MTQPFDFEKALEALQSGQALTGKDDILTSLIKQLTEAALATTLDSHLANDTDVNRRRRWQKKPSKRRLAALNSLHLATATAPSNRN